MAFVMKGIDVVNSMKERMLIDVERLKKEGTDPCLAIIRLGTKPDDLAYERGAVKRCEGLGIRCVVNEYPENIGQEDLIKEIQKINGNGSVHGILLFRPLPKHLDINVIKHIISPEKDIDCLNPVNVAKVFEGGEACFAPCTPAAVMEMLDYFKIDVSGKRVVLIGRSLVVGKPLSMLLLKKNATVTICHTKTRDIEKICKSAEILIAAAGAARMVTAGHVSPGQVVVDVGINVDENGRLCGDVDFDAVEKIVNFITPVPGGVGTVTSSVLAKHAIKAACLVRA